MPKNPMFSEGRFTPPREEIPHPEWWNSTDQQGTEWEVSEFIGGLVRALQPRLVLETGSYDGQTTEAIAQALERNGHGRLVSIELDKKNWKATKRRVGALDLKRCEVEIIEGNSLEYTPSGMIDLAFLDSGPGKEREEEFTRFFPWFHRGTIVCIHDTARLEFEITQGVLRLSKDRKFNPVFFPTPRGFCIGNVVTDRWHWSSPE